jgi:hypothetical protein
VILLEAIVQVLVRPMPYPIAELCRDRPGISAVAVGRDPVRRYADGRLCRSEEGLGRGEITVLAQDYVDQGTVAINNAIQILPTAVALGCMSRRRTSWGLLCPFACGEVRLSVPA